MTVSFGNTARGFPAQADLLAHGYQSDGGMRRGGMLVKVLSVVLGTRFAFVNLQKRHRAAV